MKAVRSSRKSQAHGFNLDELLKSERIKRLDLSKDSLIKSLNRLEGLTSLWLPYVVRSSTAKVSTHADKKQSL